MSITMFVCLSTDISYAHIPQDNKTAVPIQEWRNAQDSVKIQFSYIPKKPNGDLSLKVRFLEDGNYQVISQFSSTDNIALALASFDILVPLQPFGKFNVDSLLHW